MFSGNSAFITGKVSDANRFRIWAEAYQRNLKIQKDVKLPVRSLTIAAMTITVGDLSN